MINTEEKTPATSPCVAIPELTYPYRRSAPHFYKPVAPYKNSYSVLY